MKTNPATPMQISDENSPSPEEQAAFHQLRRSRGSDGAGEYLSR